MKLLSELRGRGFEVMLYEDPFTFGKLIVVSDSALKSVHTPAEGAMGVFKVDIVADGRSPTEILTAKLYDEGGAPAGADIETLTINDHPAARMSALDELFGEQYLWYATVIQFDGEIVVYVSFTGLGVYENEYVKENGMDWTHGFLGEWSKRFPLTARRSNWP